tara:strand:+ start:774 stop:998 length:225 start_codon:yes stop_codon:yes gene_type:complete
MRLLNDEQIDKLLEVTRKGNAVQGSVLFKLAHDIKKARQIFVRLVEADKKRGVFFNQKFNREVRKIIEDAEELL